jgi:hypothetical protein
LFLSLLRRPIEQFRNTNCKFRALVASCADHLAGPFETRKYWAVTPEPLSACFIESRLPMNTPRSW